MMQTIRLTVNGKAVEAQVSPRMHLADFLREHLLLTGTHIGCEHGICGACTVEIDGEISRACITYAVSCDGASVRTIEGFDDDALMDRLRQAFTKNHALQCGYCTPGMLVAARDLVRRKRGLSRDRIRTEMSGNLCRCTGYVGIINAIEGVMQEQGLVTPAAGARPWLGPAPGPVDPRPAAPGVGAAPSPRGAARAEDLRGAASPPRTAAKSIPVTVGAIETVDGTTRLTQSFTLPHAREAVWSLMLDPSAVASCIPGLSLGAPQADGALPGRMDVALGPVKASFAGSGTVQSTPGAFSQTISGRGGDRRSGSQASGSVRYVLSAEGAHATRVDVELAYVLAGPLAQVGRSGIVRDLVRRMGETFAQNIDARLRGEVAAPAAPVAGLSLLVQLLADRLRAAFSVLWRRRG